MEPVGACGFSHIFLCMMVSVGVHGACNISKHRETRRLMIRKNLQTGIMDKTLY